MELYKRTRSFYAVWGIRAPDPHQKMPFTVQSVITLCYLIVCFILSAVYMIFKSQNFEELTNSFYVTATITLAAILVALHIWKTASMFHYTGLFETIIEKSEFFVRYFKNQLSI